MAEVAEAEEVTEDEAMEATIVLTTEGAGLVEGEGDHLPMVTSEGAGGLVGVDRKAGEVVAEDDEFLLIINFLVLPSLS